MNLGNACLLVGLSWALGCKPAQPGEVLPNVASISLVANTNQQRLYFLEDSVNSEITFDLTYYDAAKSVLVPPQRPTIQYLVNGTPILGNRYRLAKVGTYTFSAQVAGRTSANIIGPLTVVSARDYVQSVRARVAVPFVNADGNSQLPVEYTVLDQQEQPVALTYYKPHLLINDVPDTDTPGFRTNKEGTYQLQADFFGIRSNTLTVAARAPQKYSLVQLPVVIHLPRGMNPAGVDPRAILNQVNQVFRGRAASYEPNRADTFIEFIPAATDPAGQPLPVAGLHQLAFTNPPDALDAVVNVSRVLNEWCPQRYINVFVSIDWLRSYPAGYSYSFLPSIPDRKAEFTCADMRTAIWHDQQMPAVYIYNVSSFQVLAHELGHFLGLRHTFDGGCGATAQVTDVPHHQETHPSDGVARKLTCEGIPFMSEYTMDYYVYQNSFTFEQTALMRTYVARSGYVPLTQPIAGGRRSGGTTVWPTGRMER